jgi:hypothetical protein
VIAWNHVKMRVGDRLSLTQNRKTSTAET